MRFSVICIAALACLASTNALPCEHEVPCESETSAPPPCETEPPLQAPGPDGGECVHGEYACLEGNTAVCNWGTWSVTECGAGTRCVPNDWECVPESDWDRVFEQVNPPKTETSSVFNAPAPTEVPQPPEGPCTNGEFQCYGNDIIQCNLGNWVLHQCGEGTKCMDNDFECIPLDQYEEVFNRINNHGSH